MTQRIHPQQSRSETDRQKETCLCSREARNWGARLQKRVETLERELRMLSYFHHGEVKPVIMNKNAGLWKRIQNFFKGMKWDSGDEMEVEWNDNGSLVFRNKR